MTISEFIVTDNISIMIYDNIYEYEDRSTKTYLKFPVEIKNGEQIVESPITGKRIRNYSNMTIIELILYHITKQERKKIKLKQVPYWYEYITAKEYYRDIDYKTFIDTKLEDYCNYGYSLSLLEKPGV